MVPAALLAATAAAALARTSAAQMAPPPTDTAPRRTIIIVNPFSFLIPGVSGELEHAISPVASLSAGGAAYSGYYSATAKVRFYPQERAPSGFAVALGGGVAGTGEGQSVRPSVGVELDYTWVLGHTRRFALGAGAGLQRLFGDAGPDGTVFLPMGRLGVGYAF